MKNTLHLIYLSTLAFLLLFLGSCDILSKAGDSNDQLAVSNDLEKLNQRVQIINETIDLNAAKVKSAEFSEGISGDHNFVHVANVQSPVDANNNQLSATSIEIRANTVYVSYHLNGSPYAGAVDIIDVNDHENPQIISSLSFTDTDVNALEIEENGKLLWLTGGRDISSSGYDAEGHSGAIIGEIEIDNNGFIDNNYRETPLPSYSGNALVDMSRDLYVASGATGGGFFQLDKDNLQITNSIDTDSAKFIDRRKDDIIGLSLENGNSAKFDMMDFKNGQIETFNTELNITPTDGKNVIEHRAAVTYAALGSEGVKGYMFDGNPGPVVYEFNVHGEGISDVANGVTVDGKYVYIAHGIDGLYITTHPRSGQHDPESVFNWKSGNNQASANFVKTNGNYVIVANGVNGINILRRN